MEDDATSWRVDVDSPLKSTKVNLKVSGKFIFCHFFICYCFVCHFEHRIKLINYLFIDYDIKKINFPDTFKLTFVDFKGESTSTRQFVAQTYKLKEKNPEY